jgi:hypothetical protein
MKAVFEAVKVPSPKAASEVHKLIEKHLEIEWRLRLYKAQRKAILTEIDDWDMLPQFKRQFTVSINEFTHSMFLKMGKAGWIYTWVDLGTGIEGPKGQAYPIEVKNANNLEFFVPYTPKTIPPNGLTYATGSVPKYVRTKIVIHPGIRPRKITEIALDPFDNPSWPLSFQSLSRFAIDKSFDKAFRMGIL